MSPSLTHICLHVRDLERCVDFYRRYCNLEPVLDRSSNGTGSVYLRGRDNSTAIVVQIMGGGPLREWQDSDNSHLGFSMETAQEVDQVARLAARDNRLVWEPDEHMPGAYLCGILDPNGNCVEFSYQHDVPPE